MYIVSYLIRWLTDKHYGSMTLFTECEQWKLEAFRRVGESYWMVPGTVDPSK